jgi:hypothetical protein
MFAAAGTLGAHVSPHLAALPYAAGHANVVALLLILAAQESDRAADTLVRDIEALRALFRDAAMSPLDEDLRARLSNAGAGQITRYFVSTLQAEHDALSALLIALHEAVEARAEPWAAALEARILALLAGQADARALVLPSV